MLRTSGTLVFPVYPLGTCRITILVRPATGNESVVVPDAAVPQPDPVADPVPDPVAGSVADDEDDEVVPALADFPHDPSSSAVVVAIASHPTSVPRRGWRRVGFMAQDDATWIVHTVIHIVIHMKSHVLALVTPRPDRRC
jgi:hypothetical protein